MADLITGVTPPREPGLHGGGIPLVRPGDLDGAGHVMDARERVPERDADRLLPAGSVLVSCIGILGKVGILEGPAITNQQITALVPRPGIVPEYLFYWAQTLRPWLRDNASATTIPIVNQQRLGSAPFPLQPLLQQQRVVAALRQAEARHQRATAALAEVPALLAQLQRALVSTGLLHEGAPRVPLSSVARVQVGYAFRSDWFAASGVRLLRGVNVAPGAVGWEKAARLPTRMAARFGAYQLRAGDLVIGLDRPIISTGIRVARLQPTDVPALLVQRVGRLLLHDAAGQVIDPDYLLLYLQSECFRRHLAARATGTQLPHVSAADVEAALLPLPPLPTQRLAVARTAAACQRAAAATAEAATARARSDELWQQLLARTFAGSPVTEATFA